MMMLLPLLLLVALLSLPATPAAEPLLTFQDTDPVTGMSVDCDRCPPGSYLAATCTSARKSECAPCPPGSFTELWNYIGKCLRCGACGQNQVVTAACSADSDCRCECRQGYYYKKKYGMCIRHSQCPPGQGARTQGTADEDTVCHTCPNGTYSDTTSAHKDCTEHRGCGAAGLQLALKGSAWHDSVCTSCEEPKSRDGANYLKEILPSFFAHQKISTKRLRQITNKLPSEDGKKQGGTSRLSLSDLHAKTNAWVASATAQQIRQLPMILTKTGARGAGEKLESKLRRIDTNLHTVCPLQNEVDVV